MYDLLPFLRINSNDPKEQVKEIEDYLFQLKEELEFILTNINIDNLSQELVDRLKNIDADINDLKQDI